MSKIQVMSKIIKSPEEFAHTHPTGMNECYQVVVELASKGHGFSGLYRAMEEYAKYYHKQQMILKSYIDRI